MNRKVFFWRLRSKFWFNDFKFKIQTDKPQNVLYVLYDSQIKNRQLSHDQNKEVSFKKCSDKTNRFCCLVDLLSIFVQWTINCTD